MSGKPELGNSGLESGGPVNGGLGLGNGGLESGGSVNGGPADGGLGSRVPRDRIASVQGALLGAFGTTTVTSIEPVAGGLSAASVYKIGVNGKQYLLKLDTPLPPDKTGIGLSCGEIATRAGVAPPMYFSDAGTGITISAFIPSRPLREVFTTPERLLGELAKTIGMIHSMPALPRSDNMEKIVDGIIDQLKASPVAGADLVAEVSAAYAGIRDGRPFIGPEKVPSHNDLNPNNILCDGERIWVIDWDAAFQNDPYVDLAIAANFFVADEVQEKFFLEAYLGRPAGDPELERLFIMRQVCYFIYGSLLLTRAGDAMAGYARSLLEKGVNNMKRRG